MDKKILILLGIMILFPLINAQQIYQRDSIVDLKIPCYNNNTYCSATSVCNITIISFNGSAIINNKKMTQNTAYHNFTLNQTQTTESGEYTTTVVCEDNGEFGNFGYNFIITPTGKSLSTSSSITQGLILLVMFGVTIFFLIFATITDSPGVKLFFNVISYITMILAIGTGYILIQNSEVQSNLSFMVEALLFIVGLVFIVIMFYIMINQTIQALALMQIKKGFGSQYENNGIF
jgi:hypothetical protein